MLEVIAGVDDDGQLVRRQSQAQAMRELGPAHTAAQRNDVAGHRKRSCSGRPNEGRRGLVRRTRGPAPHQNRE
jgi:hypothetical protein